MECAPSECCRKCVPCCGKWTYRPRWSGDPLPCVALLAMSSVHPLRTNARARQLEPCCAREPARVRKVTRDPSPSGGWPSRSGDGTQTSGGRRPRAPIAAHVPSDNTHLVAADLGIFSALHRRNIWHTAAARDIAGPLQSMGSLQPMPPQLIASPQHMRSQAPLASPQAAARSIPAAHKGSSRPMRVPQPMAAPSCAGRNHPGLWISIGGLR